MSYIRLSAAVIREAIFTISNTSPTHPSCHCVQPLCHKPHRKDQGNMQLPAPLRLAAMAGLASAAVLPRTGTTDIQFCTASTYATGACPYAKPTAGAGTCGALTVEPNICCVQPEPISDG